MSPKRERKNVAVSARTRLLDLARRRHVESQLMLSEFATERLLYRLGV
jgi:predicted methyltransferase MtxX (methanogen marker protein 4)